MKNETLPYEKGKKMWIEIEAQEDGDLIGSDILDEVFSDTNMKPFKICGINVLEPPFRDELFTEKLLEFLIEENMIDLSYVANGLVSDLIKRGR